MLFGDTPLFSTLLLTRGCYALLTLAMLYSLRRFPQPLLYDRLVFAWSILTVLHMSWIESARPNTYIGHYTLDVLVLIVLYLVPNRLRFRIVSAALFSSLVLVGLFVSKTSVQAVEIRT